MENIDYGLKIFTMKPVIINDAFIRFWLICFEKILSDNEFYVSVLDVLRKFFFYIWIL